MKIELTKSYHHWHLRLMTNHQMNIHLFQMAKTTAWFLEEWNFPSNKSHIYIYSLVIRACVLKACLLVSYFPMSHLCPDQYSWWIIVFFFLKIYLKYTQKRSNRSNLKSYANHTSRFFVCWYVFSFFLYRKTTNFKLNCWILVDSLFCLN